MSRRMVQLYCARITAEQNEALKALSAKTRVPMAVYVREGIDLVLRQHESVASQISSAIVCPGVDSEGGLVTGRVCALKTSRAG